MDAIKHYHPGVSFCFFLLMVVLSLASMQPVFQCLSFVAVVGYAIAVSGLKAFVRGSWWLIILILIVTLFNGIFGGRGLTVLFYLDLGFLQTPITLESLVYGVCMGLMLANVILWFSVLGKLSSVQGFIELFARVSPTLGMMIARITVFIPEILAQAKLVDKAQRAFDVPADAPTANSGDTDRSYAGLSSASSTATNVTGVDTAGASSKAKPSRRMRKNKLAYAGTLSSHLMEWGMERSLITANSMAARGYGSRKRTSYRRTHITPRDLVPLIVILVLGLASLASIIWAGMEFTFYPYISPLTFWWGYIPFVLLCCVPLVMQLGEELAWWRSR